MIVLGPLLAHQCLDLPAFFIVVILVGVFCSNLIVVLTCISPRTPEPGYLLAGSAAVGAVSPASRLFLQAALCLAGVSSLCLLLCRHFLYFSYGNSLLLGSFGDQLRKDFWLSVCLAVDVELGGRRSLIRIAMDSELGLLKWPLRGTSGDRTAFL